MDFGAQFIQQFLDDRSIGTGGRKHHLAGCERAVRNDIVQTLCAAIDKFLGHCMVIALGVFLCQILGKHIMTGTGEAVAAHTSVVFLFVGGLSAAAQAHNHISGSDIGIVDDIAALHAAGDSAVHDDGAHQVAHIGRLATGAVDTDAHFAQFLHQLVGAIDDGAYHLTGNEHLVAADGAAHQNIVHRTHTEQVVGVHHQRILSNPLPHAQVARLAPIHVSKAGLGARPIGMHDVAILRVSTQYVRDNLAEGLRENALVYILYGVVHILLGCAHAAHHIAFVIHLC